MSGISARAFSICFYTASRHGNITEATETGKSKVRQNEVANAIAVVGDGDGSSSVIGERFATHIYIKETGEILTCSPIVNIAKDDGVTIVKSENTISFVSSRFNYSIADIYHARI